MLAGDRISEQLLDRKPALDQHSHELGDRVHVVHDNAPLGLATGCRELISVTIRLRGASYIWRASMRTSPRS